MGSKKGKGFRPAKLQLLIIQVAKSMQFTPSMSFALMSFDIQGEVEAAAFDNRIDLLSARVADGN
jgi:hypothetical protein